MVFLTVLLFAVCSFADAEELKWYSWNEGYELAIKEKKPVLLFVQATWCDKCRKMDKKTFQDEGVQKIIREGFLPVKYDVDVDLKAESGYKLEGKELSGQKLLVNFLPGHELGIPTVCIWTPGEDKKVTIQGLRDPGEMTEFLTNYSKKDEADSDSVSDNRSVFLPANNR